MNEGPVNYVEKGIGLHEKVQTLGHYLRQEDGIWIGGGPNGPVYVQAIIDTYVGPEIKRIIPKPAFKMRISPQKYGYLRSLASADTVVWAFLDLLNDPTLSEVDLDSTYLAEALNYLIATYPEMVTAADKAAWLA